MINQPLTRPGYKFLYELKEGEDYIIWRDQIIIVHPDRQPKIVTNDGDLIDLFP